MDSTDAAAITAPLLAQQRGSPRDRDGSAQSAPTPLRQTASASRGKGLAMIPSTPTGMDSNKRDDDVPDLRRGDHLRGDQSDSPDTEPRQTPTVPPIEPADPNAESNSAAKSIDVTELARAAPLVLVEQVGYPESLSFLYELLILVLSYLVLNLEQPVVRYFDHHPRKATRVVVFLRRGSPHFDLPYDEVVRMTCATLSQPHSSSLLITIQIMHRLTVLAFELYHDAYDWETAHEPVDLPTLFVDYGRRRALARVAARETRKMASEYVAHQHDSHGWCAQPPYLQDQTGPTPTYYNPRRMLYEDGYIPEIRIETCGDN